MGCRHLFGTTITFGTSSFAGLIRRISIPTATRAALDCTHMGTSAGSDHSGASWREKIASDIAEWGNLSVSILFDPDLDPPVASVAETITITFPLASGQMTNATLAFSGFMVSYSGEAPYDDVSEGEYEIAVNGDVTWTPGS